MLVLLPPSESKRLGGRRTPLDLDRLALPCLRPQRTAVVAALSALSTDPDEAIRVLKLTPGQRGEIDVNAGLQTSPTRAAVDRYTGVLYDALDAGSLGSAARRWLGRHVLVHTAPFGPVGALDPIPAYRLGAVATLPGLPTLRGVWAAGVSAALGGRCQTTTYCAAPEHESRCVGVVAGRTPLSDSSSALPDTHSGTCSLRPPFDTTLLGRDHRPDRTSSSHGRLGA